MKSALLKTTSDHQAVMPTQKVLAFRARDPWKEATHKARETALYRETIVQFVLKMTADFISQNRAVDLLLEKARSGVLPSYVTVAMRGAAKSGRAAPSRSSICEWCKTYSRSGNVAELLPNHKGRVVEAPAWWGPALEYYNAAGTKVDMSAVHRRLVEVDKFKVSYEQVRSYLTSVPAMLGRHSPARIGPKLYRLTQKAYIRRSTENALPGDVYVADGYRADVYLAHPSPFVFEEAS